MSAGGLGGLASQFGVNLSQGTTADLSSPSLFPDLIKSRIFAERILDKFFYTEQYGKELPLLAILTHGDSQPTVGRESLIQKAMKGVDGWPSGKRVQGRDFEAICSGVFTQRWVMAKDGCSVKFVSREGKGTAATWAIVIKKEEPEVE